MGSSAIIQGFGQVLMNVPLHNVTLQSDLVSGNVVVGVCSHIPLAGVSFILGNVLTGGRVLAVPEVIPIPGVSEGPELSQKHPEVFPVCTVTRSMARSGDRDSLATRKSTSPSIDTFLCLPDGSTGGVGKAWLSHKQLVTEQKRDDSLTPIFEQVISEEAVQEVSRGYFVSNGVLMRK